MYHRIPALGRWRFRAFPAFLTPLQLNRIAKEGCQNHSPQVAVDSLYIYRVVKLSSRKKGVWAEKFSRAKFSANSVKLG